ncbi:MAG TPA: Gfo/Idh/MocA family oxidoreductase [Planctomycetota bacterium]|nr:Gfo/Idh/MocA family oxidoreductase [Planctomycetota bacterium]
MKSLNTAVVGCGLFGENHVRAYAQHPRARCVAVYDLNRNRAKEIARKYGAKAVRTLDAIAGDRAIQAVSIATPDFAHTDTALKLLAAGKHLLIEKPITTSTAEARRILAAAKKARRTVMVDFHNHWNPPFLALKQRIEAGELGTPVMGYIRLSNPLSVPFGMLSWAGKSGPHWFLLPHAVDLMRWLIGRQKALRVTAHARRTILKKKGADTYDAIQATVVFEDCFATFETCWILPKSWPTLIDFQMSLVGSKSTAQVNCTEQGLRVAGPQRFETPFTAGLLDAFGVPHGFVVMPIYHFVDCILDGKQPVVTAADGLAATQIIEAMVRSIEEQRTVEIREV